MKNNPFIIKSILFPLILILCVFKGFSQNIEIMGTVIGEDNLGIPGVTVYEKGSSNGTTTDTDGKYSITVNKGTSYLVFSYIGYITKEVPIGNQSVIDIKLVTDIKLFDEVVIVGYGSQKKSDITGAVASLPQERLEMVPNIDVSQAIQGAVPGVVINTKSAGAAPDNDNTSIMIRGRNSIKANNSPLIVVDGIPYSGQLADINPNDIKSIEVLKDASSAAIYGSRGANGVILVNTKEGKEGKTTITYDGYYSVQRIAKLPDIMNGEEFYNFKMTRDSTAITQSEQEIYDNKAWVNWEDLALRNGVSHQHNLAASGGSKSVKFYIAGNILDVKGLAINDDYLRASGRFNIETNFNDWLSIGTNSSFTHVDQSGVSPSFGDIFWMNPLTKAYNDDGSVKIYPWEEDNYFGNPLQTKLMENINTSDQVILNNFLKVDFPFIKGLQYQLNAGFRYKFTNSGTYRGRNTTTGYENQGTADVSRGKYSNTTFENIFSYNRKFLKHELFLTGLYSFEEYDNSTNSLTAQGFPHDVLTWYSAAQALLVTPSFNYTKTALISQMIRANYGYDNRYMFTFTFRRDGYSGFGAKNKWGNFPSIALGWNIANEGFFNNKELVNTLKLRTSWGKNGNQAIDAYETIDRLSSFDYVTGTTTAPGYIPSKLGENNLGWETTESFNIGLDFGLLSNRISGDINVYNSNTFDLLLGRSISPVHGITSITQNIGKTNNRGFELSINSNNISTSNFNWTTSGNLAFVKNKIVSLYGKLDETGNEIDDIANSWFIGKPISANYDYVFEGVWQLDEKESAALYGTQPGYIKIKDADRDTTISSDDRQIIGQRDPKFTWGLTNTIKYQNFTLSFFIYGIHGVTKQNSLWSDDVWTEVRRNTTKKNWWTEENGSNEWYMNKEDANKEQGMSASKYENASFIRLKDLTLAYDLPQNLLDKLNVKKLRIYVAGRNLMTFTEWTGLDPELDNQRAIPLQKEYVIGLNLGF